MDLYIGELQYTNTLNRIEPPPFRKAFLREAVFFYAKSQEQSGKWEIRY